MCDCSGFVLVASIRFQQNITSLVALFVSGNPSFDYGHPILV